MMYILLGVTRLQDKNNNVTEDQMLISSVISRFGFDKLLDTRPSIEEKRAGWL